MDVATHVYLHNVFGARWVEGLGLTGIVADGDGSSNTHAQLGYGAGEIRDEDLRHINTDVNTPANIPIFYRSGINDIRVKTANAFPLIGKDDVTSTTRPKYNLNTSGTWSLSEVGSNQFWLMHYFSTNDINSPLIGWVGTSLHNNVPEARAVAVTEINELSGLPFAEFVPIGTVIFKTDSYSNTPNAIIVY